MSLSVKTAAGRLALEYLTGIVLVVSAVLAVAVLGRHDEVRLCKRAFTGLVKGDASVRNTIEWTQLKALAVDVGAAYSTLSPQDQAAYQEAFIKQFSEGFRQGGATARAFTHWRRQEPGTVAVDYPAKQRTLLFRLTGAEPARITGIAWQ